ncbi:MAG: hypothetical protein ACM3KM_01370 [Acidobacteriaceae bacterium]
MALTDHTIDSSKVSEELIESIISERVKYDPAKETVVLLPAARGMTNDKRILLYLAALKGWRFLIKENPPQESASPSGITKVTGIPGGSVRPLLRGLEDRKILITVKGKYEVPAHNLGRVRDIIIGTDKILPSQGGNHEKKGKISNIDKNRTFSNKPSASEAFNKLLQNKWFKDGRTLGELKNKLKEMAIIVPASQLPQYLLKACRGENPLLNRKQETIEGKKLWVYSSPNKNE